MGENANEVAAQPLTLVGVNHRLMENKAVELLTLRLYSFMNRLLCVRVSQSSDNTKLLAETTNQRALNKKELHYYQK